MRTYFTFVVVITVLTFGLVGFTHLILSQPINWFYLAVSALVTGLVTGIVLKKI